MAKPGDNVLIVEDEEEWSEAYKRAVAAIGKNHMIKVAKDFTTAERLIESAKFAVAFVDVGLDVSDDRNVDGLSVMEMIRATDDETSIIVVTGRSGQDVLPITRDAIKKYRAYDTVGKRSVEPADIRRLFEGGLEEYRKAVAADRKGAPQALRGDSEPLRWDDQVMRSIKFKANASDFYGFLDRLFRSYLPIVASREGERLEIDSPPGLVSGAFWSRAIAAAVVICFGEAAQFDEAMEKLHETARLLDRYDVGDQLKEMKGSGVKGAVFLLPGHRREDFG